MSLPRLGHQLRHALAYLIFGIEREGVFGLVAAPDVLVAADAQSEALSRRPSEVPVDGGGSGAGEDGVLALGEVLCAESDFGGVGEADGGVEGF